MLLYIYFFFGCSMGLCKIGIEQNGVELHLAYALGSSGAHCMQMRTRSRCTKTQKPPTFVVRVRSRRLTAVTLARKRKCAQVLAWRRRRRSRGWRVKVAKMIDVVISVVRLDWEMQRNTWKLSLERKSLKTGKRLRRAT